jgi:phosphoribosylformylglycinamidine cyclo-ligase
MPSRYSASGVNITLGDRASALAFAAARRTFSARKNLIGAPDEKLKGSFAGAVKLTDQMQLVTCTDGVGTKMAVAHALKKYGTLGYDLLAMVADDAICVGAETISLVNTIDTPKVDLKMTADLMQGLERACREQQVTIVGGEIAELGNMLNTPIWNATAVGIVEREKFITGNKVRAGDAIVALREKGFRSNGFSLVRKILNDCFGAEWFSKKYNRLLTWGEAVLKPSKIYSAFLLELIGRYGQKPRAPIHGLAHITGGGIPGNLPRCLPKGLGAELDNLFPPSDLILKIQELGKVPDAEAYEVWNMGNGMLIVTPEPERILNEAKKWKIEARVAGKVLRGKKIEIISRGVSRDGEKLKFKI